MTDVLPLLRLYAAALVLAVWTLLLVLGFGSDRLTGFMVAALAVGAWVAERERGRHYGRKPR